MRWLRRWLRRSPNRRMSCQDDDEEEEEAASKCFVLHIHCGRQRARSALVPVGVEPRFNETFLINLQVSTAAFEPV